MNYTKKDCIAMLLAGGQGSRLMVLTEETAKPAVPFGGKYRIIDFPLSNCVNSEIDTVGILTQYQPLELNEYIGNGQPWGLNRNHGGAHILPPYARSRNSSWYSGTANAIYQNIPFIERYHPENVLILSGDHIYTMDYRRMLSFHTDCNADCTIAVRNVPLSEASRFGIMNTREDHSIYEFEEKPKQPKSTLASMGIYIFRWNILRKYLIDDAADPNSANDFGRNVIPALLRDRKRLFAYAFEGYWKDVGTIQSLWEANMDLLCDKSDLQLMNPDFRIYARNYAQPSTYICAGAVTDHSYIAEGCEIFGEIHHSIISTGCRIGAHAMVCDSVIMPNAIIEENAVIRHAIIGEESHVMASAKIGDSPASSAPEEWGITVIGKKKTVKKNAVIRPKSIL